MSYLSVRQASKPCIAGSLAANLPDRTRIEIMREDSLSY